MRQQRVSGKKVKFGGFIAILDDKKLRIHSGFTKETIFSSEIWLLDH